MSDPAAFRNSNQPGQWGSLGFFLSGTTFRPAPKSFRGLLPCSARFTTGDDFASGQLGKPCTSINPSGPGAD